jgi:hypothetical protein
MTIHSVVLGLLRHTDCQDYHTRRPKGMEADIMELPPSGSVRDMWGAAQANNLMTLKNDVL